MTRSLLYPVLALCFMAVLASCSSDASTSADIPATPSAAKLDRPTVTVDYSCTRDSDCVVKDVGNCCGYYPACVNVDSPTDPAAVQAECEKNDMQSICGFPEISSCACVENNCRAGTQSELQILE